MGKCNITTDEAARCLQLLQTADEPLVAAEIAARLHLAGSRESRRRHVRRIVEHLRDNGSWVIATQQQGYWLTSEAQMWRDYINGCEIQAKRILAESGRRKRRAAGAPGQGVLFDMRVPAGCATVEVG